MAIDNINDLIDLQYSSAGTNSENDLPADEENHGSWSAGEEITVNKLNHMDNGIYNATEGVRILAEQVSTLDTSGIGLLDHRVDTIEDTLASAKGGYSNIVSHLNAIDTAVEGINDTVNSAVTGAMNNNTTINNISTTVSNLSDEIQNAHRIGSELVNPANNYVDSLDSRFDAIEAVLRSKNNNSNGVNLNARFIALEAAIETITGSDVNSGSLTALAARITVLENALKSALDSDEDNVWETLENYLSDLEQDVANLKAEVGQFNSSRIDALTTEITNKADKSDLQYIASDFVPSLAQPGDIVWMNGTLQQLGDNYVYDSETGEYSGDIIEVEVGHVVNSLNRLQNTAAEVIAARGGSANLDARLDTLAVADTVKTTTDALDTRLDAIDGGATLTGNTLVSRVTALENNPSSATVIINKNSITYNNNGIPVNIGQEASADKDYLLQGTDDKYYYWKYINDNWQLISGAGENSDDLTEDIKKYNIIKYTNNEEVSYLHFFEYDYGYDNSLDDTLAQQFVNWTSGTTYAVNDYVLYNNYIYQCITENSDVAWDVTHWNNLHVKLLNTIELPQGGGGGPASNTITISNLVRSTNISNGADAIFSFTATTSDESDITSIKWYVDGIEISPNEAVEMIPASGWGISGTTFKFNAKGLLKESNRSTVRVEMISEGAATFSRSWPIESNEFSISWNNTIQPIMLYTNGNAVSTIVNVIAAANSNNIVEVTVNNHSKSQTVIGTNNVTFSLNAEWFNIGKNIVTAKLKNSTDINEENVKTIHYIALWGYNATTPLVAFSDDEFEGQQYEEILVNYYAYDPTNESTTVTLTFNDGGSNPISRTAIVGREMQPYRYVSNKVGTITAQLTTTYEVNGTVQSVSDIAAIKVNASSYNLGIVSGENLQYNFDPNGRSNNDLDKEQFAGNITFSENFDWINGGFKQDSNGSTAFVVKKGNTITLPRTLFSEDDDNGKTIDICFKVVNSDIYDAQAMQDIDSNSSKGIILKANYGELYLNNSTPQVFRYCEENRIDMSIHVEGTVNQRIVTVWLDGIPSYAGEYTSEMLEQKNTAATIIGSEHCDVWVYAIRVYNSALTEKDMVQNYIANGVNINDKIKRYTENNIYDSRTKTVSGQGIEYYSHTEITPKQLHIAMPDLTIVEIEADKMTKTNSDPVPAHIIITDRVQITEGNKISYEDRITELDKSNCLFKVQGTSSVAYARSALNLDIDFKNCKDANQNSIKYKISDNSIGVNYFNIKANVASSENANNVCAVDWYNTYQPFTIEARKENSSVRDTIEAKPCAVFFKNTSANTIWIGSQQVASGEQTLYFMGDLCNSKKNLEVFGEDGTGEHYTKCCIEDSGNDTPEQRFLTAPVYNNENDQWDSYDQSQGKYVKHFEWRMKPSEDDKQACITAWTETATWVVSTINNPEKFKAEFDQYFISQAMLYHFLMIEYFAAYDNVSKNTFYSFDWDENADQTKWGGYRWSVNKAYDWDTILAYDNDGKPLGDYGVDFGDTENGRSLFNAADNPIWNNIQTAYKNELNALYIQLRGQGAWNSNVIAQKWNEYQALRPHAAMVRDAYVKYIYPYKTTGVIIDTNPLGYDNNYIGRLAGSKIYQRAQYFTYQTSYMDGKYGYYNQNDALQFRTNGIAGTKNFTVKSYAKTYMTLIKDGQSLGSLKVEKGAEVIFQNATVGNNTTMYLTPDRLVQYIRPLNETQNSTFVASGANKLMEVILGGDEINSSWSNTSNIVVPSPILKTIDLHNITTFASALNLSTNTELTTIDTRNTNAGNITIAPYAPLTSVHLNACSGLTLNHINTIANNNNFTIESGENLSYIRIEDCNYIIMSKIIDALEAELETKDFSQISVRITGLHGVNGNNTPFQLSSTELLNKLQNAKAIDALGNSGIAPCVLAGRIHVPTIGSVELTHFNTIWPNLTITYDEQIQQQTIRCVDEDEETELCSFQVQAGSNLIDPYVSGELQIAPTKTADIQYSYIFGELDQGEYIPFSGWRLADMDESIYSIYGSTPSIQVADTVTLIATYTRIPQQYVVRWMLDATHEVYRTPTAYNYGSGYTLSAPTMQYIHDKGLSTTTFNGSGSTCSYSIMTGWEKLPTNITPTTAGGTYDIYATWLTRTNVNINDVLTSNNYDVAEKLLVLKNMQTARSTLSIQDLFPVVMGYNGLVEGHSLVSNPIRYTGTSTTINDYTPFATNKSFTIAIDYKFNQEQNSTADEAVLLSCYDSTGDSKQGFKLFYNPRSASPVPQISFGDTAAAYSSTNIRTIGNSITNRGMIVLRHQANDKTLYIYVGSDNTGLATEYSSSAFRKTITNQNFVPNTNARIVLGGINTGGDTSIINARGTLYSVKYWEEDLGEGECMQLASWCHETIHFAVSDYNGATAHSAINSTLNASVVLHALNESQMGTITEPKISRAEAPNNPTIGWQPSTVRDFYNNRIYNGFPVLLQSVINSVSIPYKIASYDQDSGYVINQSGVNISKDYVFAPSCVELGENRGNHSVEAQGPFSWNNASQMTTLVYNEGSFENGNGNVNYSRLRFPYKNILLNPSATVYTKFPTTLGSFYTWALENSITLKEGDILIPENSLVAYIYVSTTSVNAGAPIITDTSSNTYLATNNGGWIESKGWWTRSVLDSNSTGQIIKFIYIDTLGALVTSSTQVNTHGINCSIAI